MTRFDLLTDAAWHLQLYAPVAKQLSERQENLTLRRYSGSFLSASNTG
jgi:hypothetical protein